MGEWGPNAWKRIEEPAVDQVGIPIFSGTDAGCFEVVYVGFGRVLRRRSWQDRYSGKGEVWFEVQYPEELTR